MEWFRLAGRSADLSPTPRARQGWLQSQSDCARDLPSPALKISRGRNLAPALSVPPWGIPSSFGETDTCRTPILSCRKVESLQLQKLFLPPVIKGEKYKSWWSSFYSKMRSWDHPWSESFLARSVSLHWTWEELRCSPQIEYPSTQQQWLPGTSLSRNTKSSKVKGIVNLCNTVLWADDEK